MAAIKAEQPKSKSAKTKLQMFRAFGQARNDKDIERILAEVSSSGIKEAVLPYTAKDGHRVDNDHEDAYAEATVFADGHWTAFVHTTPTGHVFGGCSRTTMLLYDQHDSVIFAKDAGIFCTGTRDGVFGPKEREDHVQGPPGEIPGFILRGTRRFAVVVGDGEHDTPWNDIVNTGLKIGQIVATVFSGSDDSGN